MAPKAKKGMKYDKGTWTDAKGKVVGVSDTEDSPIGKTRTPKAIRAARGEVQMASTAVRQAAKMFAKKK